MIFALRKRFRLYRDPECADSWAHYTLVDTLPFMIAIRTRKHYYVQFGTEDGAVKRTYDGHLTLPAGMRMRVHHLFGTLADFDMLSESEQDFVDKWATARMRPEVPKNVRQERLTRSVPVIH